MIRFTKKLIDSIETIKDSKQLKELALHAGAMSQKYDFDYCNIKKALHYENIYDKLFAQYVKVNNYKVGTRIMVHRKFVMPTYDFYDKMLYTITSIEDGALMNGTTTIDVIYDEISNSKTFKTICKIEHINIREER